jgi:hypothetical protein
MEAGHEATSAPVQTVDKNTTARFVVIIDFLLIDLNFDSNSSSESLTN